MKSLALAIVLFSLAVAQSQAQTIAPITLSAQEYQDLMQQLASRDPVVAFLMQRQLKAQQEAASAAKADAQKTDVPH